MMLKRVVALLLVAWAAGVATVPGAAAQTDDPGARPDVDTAGVPEEMASSTPRLQSQAVTPGGDHVGLAIAFLGDLNGDGRSELLIGAYGDDSAAGDAGAVFVIAGASGDTLLALFGRNAHDNFGASLAAVGDLDLDRVPDFAVGAPGLDGADYLEPDLGCVYLYSAADGHVIDSLLGLHPQGQFGYTVAGLGDLNDDGILDFGVGERRSGDSARPNFGTVFVCSGRTREILHTLQGNQSGDRFGHALAGVGDVDLDGTGDLAVGAYRFSTEIPSAGAIYLFSGRNGELIRALVGKMLLGHFGYGVAAAGDLDGDLRGDLLVGARFDDGAGGRAGKVFALSGADGSRLRSYPGRPGEQFGSAVAGIGDIDRDGWPDLAVGAPKAAPDGAGAVYLFSGADGRLLGTLSGEAKADNFGGTVIGGGDADGDDVPDVAVSALGNDDGGVDAGKVYVYSGSDLGLIQVFTGRSGVTAKDTARVARVIEAEEAIRRSGDALSLPETIYDSTQVDVMPILRRSVSAEYPVTAMGSGLSGWVNVRILVLADGAPGKVDIEDDAGLGPDFRLAALTAARQWYFLPATRGGEPVPVWTVFPIGFAPEEAKPQPAIADSVGAVPTTLDSLRRDASDSGVADVESGESTPADSTPSQVDTTRRSDSVAQTGDEADAALAEAASERPASVDSMAAGLPEDSAGTTSADAAAPDSSKPPGAIADTGSVATPPAGASVEVDPSRLYEISDLETVPVLVARVEPQYPAAARLAGDTATVVLRLLIDTIGTVSRIDVKTCTRPSRGFEEAAKAAARRWRFEPGRRAGRKVNCWVEYPLEFRI